MPVLISCLFFFARVANGLKLVLSASLLVRALKKPSFVTAIRCCAKGLLAHLRFTSGSVHSSDLLSVFITSITAKDTVLELELILSRWLWERGTRCFGMLRLVQNCGGGPELARCASFRGPTHITRTGVWVSWGDTLSLFKRYRGIVVIAVLLTVRAVKVDYFPGETAGRVTVKSHRFASEAIAVTTT